MVYVTGITSLIPLRSKYHQLCINKTVVDVLFQMSAEVLCTVSMPALIVYQTLPNYSLSC